MTSTVTLVDGVDISFSEDGSSVVSGDVNLKSSLAAPLLLSSVIIYLYSLSFDTPRSLSLPAHPTSLFSLHPFKSLAFSHDAPPSLLPFLHSITLPPLSLCLSLSLSLYILLCFALLSSLAPPPSSSAFSAAG